MEILLVTEHVACLCSGRSISLSAGDGRVVVAGGQHDAVAGSPQTNATDTIDLLDLANGLYERQTLRLASARAEGWSVTLPDGTVLFGGGLQAGTGTTPASGADAVYVDGSGHAGIRSVDVGPEALRWSAPAVLLDDGTVLVAGGLELGGAGGVRASTRAEVYQPRYQGSATDPYR